MPAATNAPRCPPALRLPLRLPPTLLLSLLPWWSALVLAGSSAAAGRFGEAAGWAGAGLVYGVLLAATALHRLALPAD